MKSAECVRIASPNRRFNLASRSVHEGIPNGTSKKAYGIPCTAKLCAKIELYVCQLLKLYVCQLLICVSLKYTLLHAPGYKKDRHQRGGNQMITLHHCRCGTEKSFDPLFNASLSQEMFRGLGVYVRQCSRCSCAGMSHTSSP